MPTASTVALAGALAWEFPALRPLLQEHLDDNLGEVLPHLFLSDLARWAQTNVAGQAELVSSVLEWLELTRSMGDTDIVNLIDVSFVEMLPLPGEPGAEVRDLLGTQMAVEAARLIS